MSNVISLKEKLEAWKLIYQKDEFQVYVSNCGRFKIHSGNKITCLDFFDSVFFLKELSEALEFTMDDMGMYNTNT
jgi:hypothetical protein